MNRIGMILLGMLMVFLVVGCSSEESANSEDGTRTIDFLTEDRPDQGESKILLDLDEEIPETELETETIEHANIMQQISLLSASNDLPELFKYESAQLEELIDNGQVINMEKTFKDLGIYDELTPGAVDLLTQLSGDRGLYALPVELNIEGFWYNKKMFEENNLEVPTTWEEMMEVSAKLSEAGIQPFSVAGKEKWPITRFLNGYVIRYYGPDVMERVKKGELSVTDEGFVEGAQLVQEMNEKGYFGKGTNTIDADTALDIFLQGEAAMYYSGSWDLANFNNPERNQIGLENVGMFNIPLVEGGKGTLDDWSMNAGLTLSASAEKYDEQMGEWMKQIFSEYGDKAMEEGIITGFKASEIPDDISQLTKETMDKINSVENAALWFEARMDAESKALAEDNAQLLLTGQMSPEEYLEALKSQLEK
ncbi:ABC transporter substrate-binding protein [Halobacillus naozhouensis]|uniref:Extracellular solute-binding protein n=1 Tax=Halobacillus naozhouensis TaxID=554880 RepID=A0ABY8IYL0_9BACI|nr:extracellular solute-binding protein [Halobacillus naozhouensis]WFT75317.1 extracellular solute-binding protein [Halobacillus naozhouensis]